MKRNSFFIAGLTVLCWSAAPAHADPLARVAKHLAQSLSHTPHAKIAVLPFPYHDGTVSSGSSIISEHLTTLLVDRKEVTVIERSLLSKALDEMKLEESGVADSASTQKLGKVLGVDAIVTGTLIDFEGKETEVNARLIKTDTGEVLAAVTTEVKRTWSDLPHLPKTAEPKPEPTVEHFDYSTPIPNPSARGYGQGWASQALVNAAAVTPGTAKLPDSAEVLVLTNDDLEHSAPVPEENAQQQLEQYQAQETVAPYALSVAKRIYHRSPNDETRAKALYTMGTILERKGHPRQAVYTYQQLVREFPKHPHLHEQAQARLQTLHAATPLAH